MTTYAKQQRYWASIGFRPPTGHGRCPACGWHTATQGHPEGCPAAEEKG